MRSFIQRFNPWSAIAHPGDVQTRDVFEKLDRIAGKLPSPPPTLTKSQRPVQASITAEEVRQVYQHVTKTIKAVVEQLSTLENDRIHVLKGLKFHDLDHDMNGRIAIMSADRLINVITIETNTECPDALEMSRQMFRMNHCKPFIYSLAIHPSRDSRPAGVTAVCRERELPLLGGQFLITDTAFFAFNLLAAFGVIEADLLPKRLDGYEKKLKSPQVPPLSVPSFSACSDAAIVALLRQKLTYTIEEFYEDLVMFDGEDGLNIWLKPQTDDQSQIYYQYSWELLPHTIRDPQAIDIHRRKDFHGYLQHASNSKLDYPTSRVIASCDGSHRKFGTRATGTELVWTLMGRVFSFLPIPLGVFVMTEQSSLSDVKKPAIILDMLHRSTRCMPPVMTNDLPTSFLVSPYTCMVIETATEGQSSTYGMYIHPLYKHLQVPSEVAKFLLVRSNMLKEDRPVSLAYTLIFLVFMNSTSIRGWMDSGSLESMVIERRRFLQKVQEKAVTPIGQWRFVCSGPEWDSLIKAVVEETFAPPDFLINKWLESLLVRAKELQKDETSDPQVSKPQSSLTTTSLRHQTLEKPSGESVDHRGTINPSRSKVKIRSGAQRAGSNIRSTPVTIHSIPQHSSPSMKSGINPFLSVSMKAFPSPYSQPASGEVEGAGTRASAAERDDAFHEQSTWCYPLMAPFPVSLPLDDPSAHIYYRIISRLDQDLVLRRILTSQFDEIAARAKRVTSENLQAAKEERSVQIMSKVFKHVGRLIGHLSPEMASVKHLHIHSSFEVMSETTLPTSETNDYPDELASFGKRTYQKETETKRHRLDFSQLLFLCELKSLRRNSDKQLFRYARHIFISQPHRNIVFVFKICQSKEPPDQGEEQSTSLKKQSPGPAYFVELQYYDREGLAKSQQYSVDLFPSLFVNHLFLACGFFQPKTQWDPAYVNDSIYPGAGLPIETTTVVSNSKLAKSKPVVKAIMTSSLIRLPSLTGHRVRRSERLPTSQVYVIDATQPFLFRHTYGIVGQATTVWKSVGPSALKSFWAKPSDSTTIKDKCHADFSILPDCPDELALNVHLAETITSIDDWKHLARALAVFTGPRTDELRSTYGVTSTAPRIKAFIHMERTGQPLAKMLKDFDSVRKMEDQVAFADRCLDAIEAGLEGWSVLSKHNYLHGDISLANIIVAEAPECHFLIDYGLSISKDEGYRLPSGTRELVATRFLRENCTHFRIEDRDDLESFMWVALYVVSTLLGKRQRYFSTSTRRQFSDILDHRKLFGESAPFTDLIDGRSAAASHHRRFDYTEEDETPDLKEVELFYSRVIHSSGDNNSNLITKDMVHRVLKTFRFFTAYGFPDMERLDKPPKDNMDDIYFDSHGEQLYASVQASDDESVV